MSCRAYLWWQWDITWFTWCMFWWSTCGFPLWHNLDVSRAVLLKLDLMMFLPLYLLVMDWVFPLKLSYRIESLRIWEHLMYVLPWISVVTTGYHVIHLMYVLVINLRVPPMNLCIGVGTRFRRDSLVELWGTLWGPLCWLNRWIWDCVMHIL